MGVHHEKKWILLWSFVILLSAGVLYASMIIVWMTGATYYPTPPGVYSSGGGGTLPNKGVVKVTWRCDMDSQYQWTGTPPLYLDCNGVTIATDVQPYSHTASWDPVEQNWDITGYYKYWHTVTSSGTHTYAAEHASNTVSVNVP